LRDSFYFAAGLGAFGFAGAFGFGSALGFAGAFGLGSALGLVATGVAMVASVPNGTVSTLGAVASTLYGASTSEVFPRKNSLIFVNIMFSYAIIY
jgi:hypothetical protein